MIDLQIGKFIAAANNVFSWTQMALLMEANDILIEPRGFVELKADVQTVLEISDLCEFDVIGVWAKQALSEFDRFSPDAATGRYMLRGPDKGRFVASMGRLKDGIIGQTKTRSALLLDHHSKQLWEPQKPLFGEDFKNKFQRAEYDLDEAAKCLALGRSTACVFHLLRIVELGLGAIHQCLAIQVALTGNDRNWGNVLGRIKSEIGNRGKNWPERDKFQELYALLDAVKDAWRNATMHIESKYTPDEAQHIFNMVRGFMSKIASRMDESGMPIA